MESGSLKGDFFGGLTWGKFNASNVGYIQMLGLGPDDDDEYARQLNGIFLELKGVDTIIVDHRVNEGGGDTTATLFASYFASERTLAYTQKAVNGDTFTEKQAVFIESADAQYLHTGNVIIIVSSSDVSAGETFALSMKQLPQTVLLGRSTSGAFSDILEKSLPNGWLIGLSNEVAETPEGVSYEMVGIPPDIQPPAELLPLEERQAGIDSWLKLALETALASTPTLAPIVGAETTMAPVDGTTITVAPMQAPVMVENPVPTMSPTQAPVVSTNAPITSGSQSRWTKLWIATSMGVTFLEIVSCSTK